MSTRLTLHKLSLGAAVDVVGLSNAELIGAPRRRRGAAGGSAPNNIASALDGRTLRTNTPAARSASVPRLMATTARPSKATHGPVMDGAPSSAPTGRHPQIGDPGRLGQNHREAHGADCTWGGLSQAPRSTDLDLLRHPKAVTPRPGRGWDTARFVAFDVDAGDNRVALRNPGTKRWLRVTPDGEYADERRPTR